MRLDARAALHVAEPFLDQRLRHRPVSKSPATTRLALLGRVVLLEELHHVLVAGGREVRHVADDRPVVRMALRVEHLAKRELGLAVRAVLVTLAPLVLDDVALGVHRLRRHRLEQVAHAVRLEEQRELERVGRDVDPVVGAVVLRGAVVRRRRLRSSKSSNSPGFTCCEPMNIRCSNRCAKPVRPVFSRAEPDVVTHVRGDDGDAVVLVQDDGQPVRQL